MKQVRTPIRRERDRCVVIFALLLACSGCRSSDRYAKQDETLGRLCSIATIAGVVYKKGCPTEDIASFDAFFSAALRERVAEKHDADKLRKDGWGKSFHWSLLHDESGCELMVTCVRQSGAAAPDHEIVMRCRGTRGDSLGRATWNVVVYGMKYEPLDVPCVKEAGNPWEKDRHNP